MARERVATEGNRVVRVDFMAVRSEADEYEQRLTRSAEWEQLPSILEQAMREQKAVTEALLDRDIIEAIRQAVNLRATAEAIHIEITNLPRYE